MSGVNLLCMHSVSRKKMTLMSLCTMLLYLILLSTVFTENSHTVQAALFGGNNPSHTELYNDLGVQYDASAAEIRKAFRTLAREHHPDLKETFVEKEAAKETMAKILRAYEVLSDEEKRRQYDESGYIAGEAVNIHEMSAQQLFEHYHQVLPIISRTCTLNSTQQVHRMKRFRGKKVFLINIYEDTCTECRTFATAWETLAHSPLAESHVLEMYRIDAASRDGKELIKEVNVRYKKKQYVLAIVNGEIWPFHELSDVLKGQNGGKVYKVMLEFVMSFFHDSESLLPLSTEHLLSSNNDSSNKQVSSSSSSVASSILQSILGSSKNKNKQKHMAVDADFIVKYLQQPRNALSSQPSQLEHEQQEKTHQHSQVQVLFPSSNIAGVALPLALQFQHEPNVEVHTVERKSLLSFVEDYCDMEIEVRNRAGDLLPAPEFFVISTLPLPTELENNGDNRLENDEEDVYEHSCRGIHIGASISLDYTKACKYLTEFIPHKYTETKTLTYVDNAMTFYEVCHKNCVLWLRSTCAAKTTTPDHINDNALIDALSQNYLSFKTGFVCLDEHPNLQPILQPVIDENTHRHQTHSGVLAALMDYDDSKLYILPSTYHADAASHNVGVSEKQDKEESFTLPTKITERTISGLLALLLEHKTIPNSLITEVDLAKPIEGLLNTTAFPLHKLQRFYLMFNGIYRIARPFVTNILPFFIMYLVHTKIINPYRDTHGGNRNNTSASSASSSSPAGQQRNNTRNRNAGIDDSNNPEPPAGVPGVRRFVPAEDMKDALTGKGFLILIDDNRPVLKGALALPLIANDSRFTVRVIGPNETEWKEWIRKESKSDEACQETESQEQQESVNGNGQSHTNNSTDDAVTESLKKSEKGVNVFAIRKQRMKGIVKSADEDLNTFLNDLVDGTKLPSMELPSWMKKVK